jgi:hypothetical protein
VRSAIIFTVSPNIVRVIKPRMMWEEHIACMREMTASMFGQETSREQTT